MRAACGYISCPTEVPRVATFEVQSRKVNDAVVVRLVGEAGMLESETLEKKLDEVIVQQPPLAVVDMSELQFITSLGLGALTRFKHAVGRHGKVKIVVPAGHVRDMMFRSRVIDLFEEADSVENALQA